MAELAKDLIAKLAAEAGTLFTVTEQPKEVVFFENFYLAGHGFYLHCEFLTEYEMLEVAKIIKELFVSFPKLTMFAEQEINLNIPRKSSADFVRAVISIDGSAFHKFLLLTSGRHLLWQMRVDQVIALAQAKQAVCSPQQTMALSKTNFRDLKQLYILPGVATDTLIFGSLPDISSMSTRTFESTVKLMAFISNNSEISFSEHCKLDFAESIATENILPYFVTIGTVQRQLKSRHKELAESMTARDLTAFSSFITKSVQEGNFPESILRNRAAAVASSSSFDPYLSVTASVSSFLSDEETASLQPDDFEDDLNIHIVRAKIGADTPLIVYAALAEVLAVKGITKAFEVAREMNHFSSQKEFELKHYEATVALIAEALKPENDDFPFSWYSQLSEHAWVTRSHLSDKELAEMV